MNISNSRMAASHLVTGYPRDKVVGVGLVATHQPGVDRVAEQASDGDVMNFDLGQRCADGFAYGHAGTFGGGADATSASAETNGAIKLGQECVALEAELQCGRLVPSLARSVKLRVQFVHAPPVPRHGAPL